MKKALIAVVAAAAIFFVYIQIRSRPHKVTEISPLPPPAEAPKPAPPTASPVADAVQASLRNAASKAELEALLNKGADVNGTDRNGRPALTLAIRNDDMPAVALLLAKGADPNKRDHDMQWTPLMHSAFLAAREPKYLKELTLLLSKGADPNADKDGTTALHIAVNNLDAAAKNVEVLDDLLKAGAKPNGVAATGPGVISTTPMTLAAWNGKTAAALALARAGADAESGAKTARNNKHPELAAALEKLVKHPGGPKQQAAKKAAPRKKHR